MCVRDYVIYPIKLHNSIWIGQIRNNVYMKKGSKNKTVAIFEGSQIRRHWDDEKELWYFSVSDVIAVLTKSVNPVVYWRKLKERLLKEGGNETVTKCHGLKMIAPDGKMRLTDAADTEVKMLKNCISKEN